MLGLQILDLVFGLIFIYFMLSLVCSAVEEVMAGILKFRFRHLEAWVLDNFKKLGRQILDHNLISGLTTGRTPSYIPADKFASALLDLVHIQVKGDKPFDINSLREALEETTLLEPEIRRFLLQSIMEANDDIDQVRKDLETWFNDAMDRVSGKYKKHVQWRIVAVSFFVVLGFNADSIKLSQYLYDHPAVARSLTQQAESVVQDPAFIEKIEKIKYAPTPDTLDVNTSVVLQEIKDNMKRIAHLSQQLQDKQLPLGWTDSQLPQTIGAWLSKIVGTVISILAVSLGAPFWFETLNKMVNLRNAGNKPGT